MLLNPVDRPRIFDDPEYTPDVIRSVLEPRFDICTGVKLETLTVPPLMMNAALSAEASTPRVKAPWTMD